MTTREARQLAISSKENSYQRDPSAHPKRLPANGSLAIVGAGWYGLERTLTPK